MNKILRLISLFIIVIAFLVPTVTKADSVEQKVNIYFFHGDGCPHCEAEMKFFDNLEEEYKSKYNLYKFETWYNENNVKLKKLVIDME